MPIAIVFVAGAFAVLCLLGINVLNQAVSGLLQGIPLIGGALARTVQLDAQLVGWLWDHVTPHSQGLQQVHVQHATEQGLNVAAHQANVNAIAKIYDVGIPRAQQQVLQQTMPIRNAWTDWITGDAVASQNFIVTATPQLADLTQRTHVALPQQIAQAQGSLQSEITANALTATTDLNAVHAGIERDITTAAAGAQAGAVRQLAPQIGAIQTDLGGLTHTVTDVLAPGLVGVATLAQTLVGRVTQVEECTAGICSTGSGNILGDLGKVLQQLTPLLEGGILFALVAEAARNPAGVADEVHAVLSPVATEAASLFRDATGVAA